MPTQLQQRLLKIQQSPVAATLATLQCGIEKEGLNAAYRAYDIERCVVLVSKRGHYSFRKSGGVLGIGNE